MFILVYVAPASASSAEVLIWPGHPSRIIFLIPIIMGSVWQIEAISIGMLIARTRKRLA